MPRRASPSHREHLPVRTGRQVMDALRIDPRAPLPARSIPFAVPSTVRPHQPGSGLDDPSLYFNRELSWIDFNWRVLHQAMDERLPLLERVRFLSITQSNLDEFV